MSDIILILIAGLFAMSFICPFAEAYSKWKKVMQDAEEESGEKDVQD